MLAGGPRLGRRGSDVFAGSCGRGPAGSPAVAPPLGRLRRKTRSAHPLLSL